MTVKDVAQKAKSVAPYLNTLESELKKEVLLRLADKLEDNKELILEENNKDVKQAQEEQVESVLIKRLKLTEEKIIQMASEVREVSKLDDPVGKILSQTELDKNLILTQVSAPIGVIATIFESRPDAVTQISSLCFKSSNALILKGGSEAKNSNKILFNIIRKTYNEFALKENIINLIETREDVKNLLECSDEVDLVIPRGSNAFVQYIQKNTTIPVLGHADGICHIYVDNECDLDMALDIIVDAKTQYPAVCNAVETLLVHHDVVETLMPKLIPLMNEKNVELRADEFIFKKFEGLKAATENDWSCEYTDLILSLKTVSSMDEAIEHINYFGSGHTDAIVTKIKEKARKFQSLVDSSSVLWNCSTRFADGFRYGKGAEVGISTSKIHARGPVGLEGLILYKYFLEGNGHLVKDYASGKKQFTHKKLI